MVDSNVRWGIVNGMSVARDRGHGEVTRYLESVGVPRSTAYRWELDLRWLMKFGPTDLRQLRRERDKLYAKLQRLLEANHCVEVLRREQERAFIVTMAVLGNSDAEIAALLETVGGRSLSHETIRATINEAAALARVAFARFFSGVGTIAAVDEIFLGKEPLLLAVGPVSLLISALRLSGGRTGEDWKPVFVEMSELVRGLADGGKGIAKAAGEAGIPIGADMWHLLRKPRAVVEGFWKTCESKMEAELEAERKYEAIRHSGTKKASHSARQRYYSARGACNRALEECCRLDDIFGRVEEAFDYTTPDGKLNTAPRAQRIVAEALEALKKPSGAKRTKPTKQARRLAAELAAIERAPAFAHLQVLEAGLSRLRLEQAGPDREATLARQVAETVALRRTDKDPVEVFEEASDGSLSDKVEITLIKLVDLAARSSSSVECVNARVRTVQVARKRLSEDFVYLLAVHHNMKPFGRGSVREGKSPAQLAAIDLPTDDWIELLDLMRAAEPGAQAAGQAA